MMAGCFDSFVHISELLAGRMLSLRYTTLRRTNITRCFHDVRSSLAVTTSSEPRSLQFLTFDPLIMQLIRVRLNVVDARSTVDAVERSEPVACLDNLYIDETQHFFKWLKALFLTTCSDSFFLPRPYLTEGRSDKQPLISKSRTPSMNDDSLFIFRIRPCVCTIAEPLPGLRL